jgi:hypothetical protein
MEIIKPDKIDVFSSCEDNFILRRIIMKNIIIIYETGRAVMDAPFPKE